ncbi:MAG: hypothetical protein II474_09935, partial [Firmicutes bacterium]|nr:hypothetical protein [Bacillota bacterium]
MNNNRKRKEKRIRTGSIALRIALGSALYLLLAFVVVDLAVFWIEARPQIAFDSGMQPPAQEVFTEIFAVCRDVLTNRRFDLLL